MRARDERGAVAVLMVPIVAVVVLIAAFAVDLGMQRVVRSDMQALADAVALDTARLLGGGTAQEIRDGDGPAGIPSLAQAVEESVQRNVCIPSREGEIPVDPCKTRKWDVDPGDVQAFLVQTVQTDSGAIVPMRNAEGEVVEVDPAEIPGAIYVVAQGAVKFAFRPGTGSASRSALGVTRTGACIQLGSYAASINPSSSTLFKDLLTPLLGSSTLNAVGYNGLASANISLLDLISAPSIGLGTVDEFLAAPDITAADIFLAGAHVLQDQGRVAEAAVLSAAATSVVAPIILDMGKFLSVDGASSEAVLGTEFNALDLLIGTAFLANGDNFLALPNLQAGLSSIGVTNTQLKIIEKARRHCLGGPDAQTSQVSLTSNIKAEPSNQPLFKDGKVDLRLVNATTGIPSAEINLALDAQLAGARGRLTGAICNPDTFDFDVWTDLVTMSLSGSARIEGGVKIDVTVLGIPLVGVEVPLHFDISVAATANKPAETTPVHGQLAIPPGDYADPFSVGSGDLVLPNLSVTRISGSLVIPPVKVSVLGLGLVTLDASLVNSLVTPILDGLLTPTGAVTNRIVPIVQPVVTKVNDILVQLNTALGMNLGGADVYALPRPICNAPQLRG